MTNYQLINTRHQSILSRFIQYVYITMLYQSQGPKFLKKIQIWELRAQKEAFNVWATVQENILTKIISHCSFLLDHRYRIPVFPWFSVNWAIPQSFELLLIKHSQFIWKKAQQATSFMLHSVFGETGKEHHHIIRKKSK